MSRRYLAFVIGINAIISLAITLLALWLVELRRPDPEQLASIITPRPQIILAATPVPVITPQAQSQEAVPPPTATPQTAQAQGEPYTVKSGDSLSSIAARYNVSLTELLETNNLENPDFVFVGQRIFLPVGAKEIPLSSDATTVENSSQQPVQEVAVGLKIANVEGVTVLESEVLQIINESDSSFNLQGWRIRSTGSPDYTFGNLPIFPGGGIRLHSQTGTNTSIDLYWGQSASVWQAQQSVQLVDNQGRIVHQYVIP